MVLDVVEENSGRFLIWGAGAAGESVLLCVADFEPYFYVAAPRDQVRAPVVWWPFPICPECCVPLSALSEPCRVGMPLRTLSEPCRAGSS